MQIRNLFFGLLLSTCFLYSTQHSNAQILKTDSESDALRSAAAPVYGADPGEGFTLVQTDVLNKDKNYVMNTYRMSNGQLLSCYIRDQNNYCWFKPETSYNRFSGEQDVVAKPTPAVVAFIIDNNNKEFYPNRNSIYEGDELIYGADNQLLAIGVDRLPVHFKNINFKSGSSGLWDDDHTFNYDDLFEHLLNGKNFPTASNIAVYYNGKWRNCVNQQEANNFSYSKIEMPGFLKAISNDELIVLYQLKAPDLINRAFYNYNEIMCYKVKNIILPSGTKVALPLPGDYNKKITNIDEQGKIVTFHFEDGDYIKLSTYAEKIMEGTITTPFAKIKASNDRLEIFNLQPVRRKEWIPGYSLDSGCEVLIPENSKFTLKVGVNNYMTFLFSPQNLVAHATLIEDPEGVSIYANNKLFFPYIDKIIDERVNEETAANKAIYDKYCAKYGKQYVDAALRKRIIEGMPYGLINDIWYNHETQTGMIRGKYAVHVTRATFNPEKGTIEGRLNQNTSNYSSNATRVHVLIRNGKVDHIYPN